MTTLKNHRVLTYIGDNYIILLIILLGAILRIYYLSGESLWLDEAVSAQVSKLSLTELIQWMIDKNDNNPPLYYMLLHFWVSLFGYSEFSLRLPSAILGSCSVLVIYMVGKQLFSRTVGILASLILAISVFHIEYSQEARAYALMAFLTLLSYYFFIKTISGSKNVYAAAYVISSVLLMYSHFYGVLIIVSQSIFCFTRYLTDRNVFRIDLGKWVKLEFIIGLLFIPGLAVWLKNTLAMQGGFWLSQPTVVDIARYFYHFSGRDYVLFFLFFFLALFSLINFSNIRRKKGLIDILDTGDYSSGDDSSGSLFLSNFNRIYLLLLWLFVPIIIPFIISLVSTPILHTRYIIGSSLALYLLVAKGICNTNSKKMIIIIPVIIAAFSLWPLRMYYVDAHKHQWREVVAYIENNAGENESIFVYPVFDMRTVSYYRDREDLNFAPLTSDAPDKSPGRFWVVIGLFAGTDEEAIKRDMLGDYDLISEKNFNRLNIYLYEKRTE